MGNILLSHRHGDYLDHRILFKEAFRLVLRPIYERCAEVDKDSEPTIKKKRIRKTTIRINRGLL